MGLGRGALEGLGVSGLFADAYRGRKVLLTGHTGFKGSWLALWLRQLGAEVAGVSLAPWTSPSHWDLLRLDMDSRYADIRDFDALRAVFAQARPEMVFHLAAQPLVRRSYADPLFTWSTNVAGTANVLEACRQTASVRAAVAVTTDKCYENQEWLWGYRESDPLGGHDPYSASKAAAELVAQSYRRAFFSPAGAPLLATARAGNVVGGGDWSEDRLVPDLVRALARGESLEIRSPRATRPWQHVLESLSGYLSLGQRLLQGEAGFAEAWNFGPDDAGNQPVERVLESLRRAWPGLRWHAASAAQPHEAGLLRLDSTKARQRLGWTPVWDLEESLAQTAHWYRRYLENRELASAEQLARYVGDARRKNLGWAG